MDGFNFRYQNMYPSSCFHALIVNKQPLYKQPVLDYQIFKQLLVLTLIVVSSHEKWKRIEGNFK